MFKIISFISNASYALWSLTVLVFVCLFLLLLLFSVFFFFFLNYYFIVHVLSSISPNPSSHFNCPRLVFATLCPNTCCVCNVMSKSLLCVQRYVRILAVCATLCPNPCCVCNVMSESLLCVQRYVRILAVCVTLCPNPVCVAVCPNPCSHFNCHGWCAQR